MMEKMRIKRATAIYSGGGIYLYYAELKDGNWIMGDDDGLLIVNKSPFTSERDYEDSCYCEWQEKHLVKYINNEDLPAVRSEIIDTIFTGKTIGYEDNYSMSELEVRRV